MIVAVSLENELLAVLPLRIHAPDAALSLQLLLKSDPTPRDPRGTGRAAFSRHNQLLIFSPSIRGPDAGNRVLLHRNDLFGIRRNTGLDVPCKAFCDLTFRTFRIRHVPQVKQAGFYGLARTQNQSAAIL